MNHASGVMVLIVVKALLKTVFRSKVRRAFAPIIGLLACTALMNVSFVFASVVCHKPDYQNYVKRGLEQITLQRKREWRSSRIEYENSLASNANLYRVISDLSRHLIYSAQFDEIEQVKHNINQLLKHADNLRVDQQIAASVLDSFSNEHHAIFIARAWVAYRLDDHASAFSYLLESLNIEGSMLISTFGPDLHLVRVLYHDGHSDPVKAYLDGTSTLWLGKEADRLRLTWSALIDASCPIVFQSFDTTKALELGLLSAQ